jgi:TolB-like protein
MIAPPDIFLSYNREDQARAKLFAEGFEAQGFKVWWDVGLRTGEAYDLVTENALKTAKAVVVLWSRKSVESRWVRAEATLADRNKTLLPCMIEPCERPIMFELTQTAELSQWQGDAGDRAWQAFLGDVGRFVGGEAAADQPAEANPTPASVQETLKPGQRGDAPSLALLPFSNRSGQADDEIFAIGLVEDVISALSQGVDVRVLGASATASLTKGAITDLAAIGRQLGVQYLLEGNVRRAGASLRVTSQLLEAATGAVRWTGRFDRPLSEIADLQEELVLELAASLNAEVSSIEIARVLQKPDDLTVWQLLRRAQYIQFTGDPLYSNAAALAEGERALAMAPDFALANAVTANLLASTAVFSGAITPSEIGRARELADHALRLAPNDAEILATVSMVFGQSGAWSAAEQHIMQAVRKLPGSGLAQFWHGCISAKLEKNEEALRRMTTAERLMPGSHMLRLVHFWQAELCRRLERLDDAVTYANASRASFATPNTHLLMARIANSRGDGPGARREIALAKRSNVPLARYLGIYSSFYPSNQDTADWFSTLRRLWDEVDPAP